MKLDTYSQRLAVEAQEQGNKETLATLAKVQWISNGSGKMHAAPGYCSATLCGIAPPAHWIGKGQRWYACAAANSSWACDACMAAILTTLNLPVPPPPDYSDPEPTPTPGAPLAAPNPTCARCHTVTVAEEGDTCAKIPHWQRWACTYCTEPEAAPTVTLCGNGVPVVTVDRAQFEDTARAVRQQPATCQRCYFAAPQHAPGCVNTGKPRCPDCGHYWCSGCANLWPDPEPTPALPAYNPEDGAPCAQCGHGQELHVNGTEDCWWSPDATPATFCPCPQFQAREAAQRADEAAWLPMAGGSDDCATCGVPFAYCTPEEREASVFCRVVCWGHCQQCRRLGSYWRPLPPMAGGSEEADAMDSTLQGHARALVRAIQTLPTAEQARACDLVTLALAQIAQTAASPDPLPPPIAGGAPSHYADPAWLADEAWALQEERNAESARKDEPAIPWGYCEECRQAPATTPVLGGMYEYCQPCAEALRPTTHTHPCPTCHQARPCTATGCADGPRECATCSNCRGW